MLPTQQVVPGELPGLEVGQPTWTSCSGQAWGWSRDLAPSWPRLTLQQLGGGWGWPGRCGRGTEGPRSGLGPPAAPFTPQRTWPEAPHSWEGSGGPGRSRSSEQLGQSGSWRLHRPLHPHLLSEQPGLRGSRRSAGRTEYLAEGAGREEDRERKWTKGDPHKTSRGSVITRAFV